MDRNTLKELNLTDFTEYGKGATASTYLSKKDPSILLKLFNEGVKFSETELEYSKSEIATKLGLKIPPVYEMVRIGNQNGILYKKLDNKISFAKAVGQNPEKLEELAREFAREAVKLNSIKADESLVKSRRDRLIELAKKITTIPEEDKEVIIEFLKGIEESKTILHGDLHMSNLVKADGGNYWIDLSEVSYGNHRIDVGTFAFLFTMACENPIFQDSFHMSEQNMRDCFKYFVKEYYQNEDDEFVIKKTEEVLPYGVSLVIMAATEIATPEFIYLPFLKRYVEIIRNLLKK